MSQENGALWICGLLLAEWPQSFPGCFHQGLILPWDPGLIGEAVPAWGRVSCRICVSAALLGEVFVSYAFTGFKGGGREAGGKDSGQNGRLVCPEAQTMKCSSAEMSLLNIHSSYQEKSKQVLCKGFFPSHFSMTVLTFLILTCIN